MKAAKVETAREPSVNGSNPTLAGGWPEPLGDAAYHGVAGTIVRRIDPETEADPAAVLVQFLVAFGAACGREPHFYIGEDRHGTNLFATIVGESAVSRKGGSLNQAVAPIAAVSSLKTTTGLSSGEGLIAEVRDPSYRRRKAKTGEIGDEDGFVEELDDIGVSDKRLLVEETEFATVLSRMAREGNTLSPVGRQAWDGKTIRTITRGSPATATDPHIAICGHIVLEELRQKLAQTDIFNGFVNRFLWVCATRSKSLPRGGKRIDWAGTEEAKLVKDALMVGSSELDFSDEAGELWDGEYERLTVGRTGVLAAVTSRAAPQTRRLAMVYALLDLSRTIEVSHLEAALEVWRYCEDSCRYLFGDSTGDQIADSILAALRSRSAKGMTRTEIRDLLGRNQSHERVSRALVVLLTMDRAYMETKQTGGRKAEHWYARR